MRKPRTDALNFPRGDSQEITSIDELASIFPQGRGDSRNWLFLSTSGAHGTYNTLEQIEKEFKAGKRRARITVLVVKPELAFVHWGDIVISPSDVDILRRIVRSTINAVVKSQKGNY